VNPKMEGNAFVEIVALILQAQAQKRREQREEEAARNERRAKMMEGPLQTLVAMVPILIGRKISTREVSRLATIRNFFMSLDKSDFEALTAHFGPRLLPIAEVMAQWAKDDEDAIKFAREASSNKNASSNVNAHKESKARKGAPS